MYFTIFDLIPLKLFVLQQLFEPTKPIKKLLTYFLNNL